MDRAGLERLLRYCARPPFAMERLRKEGTNLVYRCAKQHSESAGGKVAELILTLLELIDGNAALVPPPRTHRQRYFGVLAPHSPLSAKRDGPGSIRTTGLGANRADRHERGPAWGGS